MSADSFVELDLHGRPIDGILGKCAGRGLRRLTLQMQKKIRGEKRAKHSMPSTVHVAHYVDLDLYGRGDPSVFGNDVYYPDSVKVKRPSDATIYRRALTISPQCVLKNTDAPVVTPKDSSSSASSSGCAQSGVVRQATVVVSASSECLRVHSPRAKSFFQRGACAGAGGNKKFVAQASSSSTSANERSPSESWLSGSPPSSAPESSGSTGTKSLSSSQRLRRSGPPGKGRELFKHTASLLKGLFRRPSSSQTPSPKRGRPSVLSVAKGFSKDPSGGDAERHFFGGAGTRSGRNLGPSERGKSGDVNAACRSAEIEEVCEEHKGSARIETSNDAARSASSEAYSDFADLAIPDDEWISNAMVRESSAEIAVDTGVKRERGTDEVGAYLNETRDDKEKSLTCGPSGGSEPGNSGDEC